MKDTKDFQERYNRWKNGERYWDIRGVELPKYDTADKDINNTAYVYQRSDGTYYSTPTNDGAFIEDITPVLKRNLSDESTWDFVGSNTGRRYKTQYTDEQLQQIAQNQFQNSEMIPWVDRAGNKHRDINVKGLSPADPVMSSALEIVAGAPVYNKVFQIGKNLTGNLVKDFARDFGYTKLGNWTRNKILSSQLNKNIKNLDKIGGFYPKFTEKVLNIKPKNSNGRYQFGEPTYQIYTGPKHDISEIIDTSGNVKLKNLLNIQNEALKNVPNGTIARHRLENQKWHPTDWNTFLHTRDAYKRALDNNYPQEALFPTLMHDFGKMWSGDGHGPYGASIIRQIFPKASNEQIQAIYEHMGSNPQNYISKLVKGADIKEPNQFRTDGLYEYLLNYDKSKLQSFVQNYFKQKAQHGVLNVYHSTDRGPFTAFKPTKGHMGGLIEPFFHFGDVSTKKFFEKFPEYTTKQFNIKGSNFLDVDDFTHSTPSSLIAELYRRGYITKDKLSLLREKMYDKRYFDRPDLFAQDVLTELNSDGIHYINKVEGVGSNAYGVTNPNYIKLSDPIVYDDFGKIIPLSQRFDFTKSDFRYNNGKEGHSVKINLPKYGGGKIGGFVHRMGPLIYQGLVSRGVKNINAAYANLMRQISHESGYGTSGISRQHNYGGIKIPGSNSYRKFESDRDFADYYLDLMTSRYRNAIDAKDLNGFVNELGSKGYFRGQTAAQYLGKLNTLKSLDRAVAQDLANRRDFYNQTTGIQQNPETNEPEFVQPVPKEQQSIEVPYLDPQKLGTITFPVNQPIIDIRTILPKLKPMIYQYWKSDESFDHGKSGIHINPANRGKFNATKKRTGKTTKELTHSKNPLTRKRAIFALNASKWNKK